jgi:putative heme-binding domain-containing protein
LLESIVSPNAKMCEGFETTVLQLDTGKVVTGIVRRENDSVIELVDAAAKTIMVDPKTIENRIKGSSAMPENLVDQMTPRQLRDIIAYLSELRTGTPSTPQPSTN